MKENTVVSNVKAGSSPAALVQMRASDLRGSNVQMITRDDQRLPRLCLLEESLEGMLVVVLNRDAGIDIAW